MSNHYFGNFENPYAASLNQYVDCYSSPTFGHVFCDTPVVERYEDLVINPFATKPGANAPDLVKRRDDGLGSYGVYLYSFPSNRQCDLHFVAQLPHGWKEGSTIYPHAHVGVPTFEAGTHITWQLEYLVCNIDEYVPNSVVSTVSQPCPAECRQVIVNFPPIDATGKKISSLIPCRFSRTPTGANEYSQGGILLSIDFHICLNTIGSATETSK